MNILAIVGSARKGKSTDTLVDMAIEGIQSVNNENTNITKINLHDYNIKFCRDCLKCRDSKNSDPYVKCVLDDDMNDLFKLFHDSDTIIIGSPLHMGHTPGIVTTLLERLCWTFGKPEKSYLVVQGCPLPRSNKQRRAIVIVTNAIIPPMYRKLCDTATPAIKEILKDSLNAKTVGDLYAGDIEHRGVKYYSDKAFKLGQKLCKASSNLK